MLLLQAAVLNCLPRIPEKRGLFFSLLNSNLRYLHTLLLAAQIGSLSPFCASEVVCCCCSRQLQAALQLGLQPCACKACHCPYGATQQSVAANDQAPCGQLCWQQLVLLALCSWVNLGDRMLLQQHKTHSSATEEALVAAEAAAALHLVTSLQPLLISLSSATGERGRWRWCWVCQRLYGS